MSELMVDLHGLADLVERMARFDAHVAQIRGDVDARVRELHGSWSGAAAQAHAEANTRWRAGAVEVHEALAVLRGIASTAHANYLAAVTANRRMWAR